MIEQLINMENRRWTNIHKIGIFEKEKIKIVQVNF